MGVLKFAFKIRGSMYANKRPLVTQAYGDLSSLLQQANLHYSGLHHQKWLGGQVSEGDVKTYTQRMVDFVNGVDITVEAASPSGGGLGSMGGAGAYSYAYCDAVKYRGQRLFGEDYASQWKTTCQLNVGPNFFESSVSRGERAQSLLHELTHLALATTDEKVSVKVSKHTEERADVDCYGADYCAKLVKKNPTSASRNAENWGYYFTAYRTNLAWAGGDDKYLEPAECKEARGKRFQ